MARFSLARTGGYVVLVAAAALLGTRTLAQGPGGGGPARTDIAGDWAVVSNEDQPHRAPGPELGDYTGLPINDADRQKAEAWDATILSQPERQTQAHPVQYWFRGPGPALRILKVLDPTTQNQVAYAIAGGFGRADVVVWMDGRPHPSDYSEHTWDGFATGQWVDGQLVVTITHMKQGVIQRNGVATSPYGVVTQHWFRHNDIMTMFSSVDDPIFLEEPFVRTHTWRWNPNGNMALGAPFEAVDELGDKPLGWVPFFPMGTMQTDYATMHNIPLKATLGGKENMYPEFQLKIAQWAAEEAAAKKAADDAKAKGPAKKK